MELIPAIDILGGQVVRLHQGKYDQVTTYGNDPVDMASEFERAGARRLHVVDLDGAREGKPVNVAVIESIVRHTGLQVQIGGGLRNEETVARWFEIGASRAVIGTLALKAPELVQQMSQRWPDALVIALDARDGLVATEGWTEQSERRVEEVADQVARWPIGAILYTNIARDGTREGPDIQGTLALQNRVEQTVIASGGIGSLAHVSALRHAGIRAAVCGRALYSGAFTFQQAQGVLMEEG